MSLTQCQSYLSSNHFAEAAVPISVIYFTPQRYRNTLSIMDVPRAQWLALFRPIKGDMDPKWSHKARLVTQGQDCLYWSSPAGPMLIVIIDSPQSLVVPGGSCLGPHPSPSIQVYNIHYKSIPSPHFLPELIKMHKTSLDMPLVGTINYLNAFTLLLN